LDILKKIKDLKIERDTIRQRIFQWERNYCQFGYNICFDDDAYEAKQIILFTKVRDFLAELQYCDLYAMDHFYRPQKIKVKFETISETNHSIELAYRLIHLSILDGIFYVNIREEGINFEPWKEISEEHFLKPEDVITHLLKYMSDYVYTSEEIRNMRDN
jgi:hypothetical protein